MSKLSDILLSNRWIPAVLPPPGGMLVLLLNKHREVICQYGRVMNDTHTHWAPMPEHRMYKPGMPLKFPALLPYGMVVWSADDIPSFSLGMFVVINNDPNKPVYEE